MEPGFKKTKNVLIFGMLSYIISLRKRLTFSIISGIIYKRFCILYSVHIIAHLPFIGRRSNEGACVEQVPFALIIK